MAPRRASTAFLRFERRRGTCAPFDGPKLLEENRFLSLGHCCCGSALPSRPVPCSSPPMPPNRSHLFFIPPWCAGVTPHGGSLLAAKDKAPAPPAGPLFEQH